MSLHRPFVRVPRAVSRTLCRLPARPVVAALLVPAATLLSTPAPAAAQLQSIDWFSATGRFSSYGELYGRSGVGEAARPDQTGRINADMTFSFANGLVVVPVNLILSSDEVAFRQSINQIGISPSWRWATLHAGHFSPDYSPYSLADATLFGGGGEVRTGMVRAGAVAGRARDAIAPQPGQLVVPEYRRTMQAGRLGVGAEQGWRLDAFLLRAEDDPASIDTASLSTPLAPQANTVTALRAAAPLSERVRLEGDLAFSRFDADLRSEQEPVDGLAGRIGVTFDVGGWTAGLDLEQVDGGFHNLGNTGLKNDRRDLRLRGQGQLWDGRFALSGSVGVRQDNLSEAGEVTNDRTIANVAGTIQPWPAFGVDFQVANDRQQADAVIRSRSQKTVTGSYTVTPRLVVRTGNLQHVVFGMAAFQSAVNTSPGTETTVDTRSQTFMGTWSLTLPSGLTFTANATRVAVEFALDSMGTTTTVTTLAPGAAYTALQGRLHASLQLQHTRTALEAEGTGVDPRNTAELFPAIQLQYAVRPSQTLTLQSSYRQYDMTDGATLPGDPASGGSFIERRVSLGYTVSLR